MTGRPPAPTHPAVLSPPAGAEGRFDGSPGTAPERALGRLLSFRGRQPQSPRRAPMSTMPVETISDPQTTMRVRKRSGSFEPVDVNKIVRAVSRCCVGLADVDSLRIATKTISGLYDGATTRELDQLSIQTAAGLIVDEPQYARLAGRLLATYVDKEVRNQSIYAFSQSVQMGHDVGLVNDRLMNFVNANSRKLNDAI